VTQSVEGVESPAVEATNQATDDATLEGALAAAERSIDEALRSANAAVGALKRAKAAARTGQVRDLRKALEAAVQLAEGLTAKAASAASGFTFDDQAYLASGGYVNELLALAQERGVAMFEEDDQLLCYPSLVRVLSADAVVEIDKARERRLRPSVLVDLLARNQERAPRFRAEAFLDSLRTAYDLVVVRDDKKPDAVVRLVEIWGVLTLLPGQGGRYSKAEFARDLYLLDQSRVTYTPRDQGRELSWSASTGTKGAGVLVTVSRAGQRQRYWGVSFTPREHRETA
jgi:hypothetical protein